MTRPAERELDERGIDEKFAGEKAEQKTARLSRARARERVNGVAFHSATALIESKLLINTKPRKYS